MVPELHELFPQPLQFLRGVLLAPQAADLRARLSAAATVGNQRSQALAHTALLKPGDDAGLDDLARRLMPALAAFGTLLLGEPLQWAIKEMWVNVLKAGGHQALHNHANCLVSGIVYLSPTEGRTQTVFHKGIGGSDFKLSNQHEGTQSNAFNAQRWIAPHAQAGDAVLFPSYLLHEVPPNQGEERVTLAFNAIPQRLDSWGYRLSLGG